MLQDIYDSQYGNVKYIEKDNVVLLTWKQKCSYDDYRNTTLAALNALQNYKNSNFVIDARNGFEDEKEDVNWGFTVLLPAMSKTDCKVVVLIMNEVNDIEDEMDMWTKELRKYFAVHKVTSYDDVMTYVDFKVKANNHVAVIPIQIKSDCIDKFIEIITENIRHSRKEKGVLSFDAMQNKEIPTEFLLIEVYMTPEDQLKHRDTEHFKIFKSQVGDLLQEPYQAKIYNSI